MDLKVSGAGRRLKVGEERVAAEILDSKEISIVVMQTY
jgi:hypothetical protein